MNRLIPLAVALILAPAIARAEAMDLVCRGTAFTTEQTTTTAAVRNSGGDYANGSATTFTPNRSAESVRVHLDGAGAGKVKLPPVLIPTISRGKDGWWDFTKLDVGDDAIHGQFSLNILNHPSVVIDRHTGDIDLRGMGMRFSGSCERAPDAAEARKF